MTYEGCHVFNPGSFVGSSFTFSAYTPSRRESEEWLVVFVHATYTENSY